MATHRSPSSAVSLLALALVLLGGPLPAGAQPVPAKVAHVAVLGVTSPTGYARQVEALKQGFRDLGYVEGRNLILEWRWADSQYERLPALAEELVRLKPDVIVTSGRGVRAAKNATTTIPIVMAVSGDVVAEGVVTSLARPGGNVTGSTAWGPELSAKRLELLKEAVPRLAKVGVLLNADNRGDFEQVRKAAAVLKVELVEAPVRSPRDFEDAFALMLRQRADGLSTLGDSMLVANMRRLGELSLAKRLPGAGSDEYAEGGGLLAYGVDYPRLWGRAAYFTDKILKGASPATIPIEQASKFSLVVNLKTARAFDLQIPQLLLFRADQVIE